MNYTPDVLKLTEVDFSTQVEDLLNLYGWRWMHSRPARTIHGWRTALSGDKGFPDYVAVRATRLIFIEIKSEKGKVTSDQQAWIEKLTGNAEVYVWRPSDFDVMVCILKGD